MSNDNPVRNHRPRTYKEMLESYNDFQRAALKAREKQAKNDDESKNQ